MHVTPILGARDRRIPEFGWAVILADMNSSRLVRDTVSTNKTEGNRGRHPELVFGLHTCTHR